MRKGFTLVEILVVIGVLGIVGTIIVTIFTRTLKSTNKTQVLLAVKQNGQSTLERLDKEIRNAGEIVCLSPIKDVLVTFFEGTYTRYKIYSADETGFGDFVTGCPKSSGCIATDYPVRGDESLEQFSDDVCKAEAVMLNPVILSDTNPASGVQVISGEFTQNQSTGFSDEIKIEFVLGPPREAPSSVVGEIDPVKFETSIQVRNKN